jgi:hypothetical protein
MRPDGPDGRRAERSGGWGEGEEATRRGEGTAEEQQARLKQQQQALDCELLSHTLKLQREALNATCDSCASLEEAARGGTSCCRCQW